MKRLWIAVSIILLLILSAWLHVSQLAHISGEMIARIEQANECLQDDNWHKAAHEVRLAYAQWESNAFYLHVTLRHTDLDSIRGSLKQILSYLNQADDKAECLAEAAQLINQLELLLEAEFPSIKNIL